MDKSCSGGGYSDKVNASVLSGNLPDVLTVDGRMLRHMRQSWDWRCLSTRLPSAKNIFQGSVLRACRNVACGGIHPPDAELQSGGHIDVYSETKQSAVVENAEVMGNENNLYFTFGEAPAVARVSKYEISRADDTIDFVFVPSKLHFFDKETETCLF